GAWHVLQGQVRRVGVRVEADRTDDVRVNQAMDGRALALEVSDVLAIGGDLDRDELVRPHVVVGLPDLAERPAADPLDEHVLTDSLVWCRHPCHSAVKPTSPRSSRTPAD